MESYLHHDISQCMTKYDLLIKSLCRYPSVKWLNQYFDLLKRLMTDFDIQHDDPRICLSLRIEGQLPANFGQRYVLEPYRTHRIGIIVPATFNIKPYSERIIFEFTLHRVIEDRFIAFPFPEGKKLPAALYNACKKSSALILDKTSRSGYRKFHSPLLYDFTMEPEVRQEILQEVSEKIAARG